MKNLLIRAFVVALAVVGFSAASASSKTVNTASIHGQAPKMGPPTPMCPPSNGGPCGLD